MVRKNGAWVISTLEDFVESRHSLTLHCRCGHTRPLDLPQLIERLGPDYSPSEDRDRFLSRFVCQKCGKRAATYTVSLDGLPSI